MSIDKITKQHVLDAVDKIEREGIALEPSTGFDVLINGRSYPPKEIMRYANLHANGTKEWPFSGGEQTNKFLRQLDFEIVPKGEEVEMLASKENFVQILKRMGKVNSTKFLSGAANLMHRLNVQAEDARITYGTRKDNKRLTITIGQRYCYGYVSNEANEWQFIHDTERVSTDDIEVTKYEGEPVAYYYRCSDVGAIANNFDGLVNAANKELQRSAVAGFRKFNNPIFEKVVLDDVYRQQIFDEAFGNIISLTGNVWKLGCNWGTGAPSFYEFIKSHSIVIGVESKLYSVGDLVIITKGQTVLSIGKVLQPPSSFNNFPEFESDFDNYEIEHGVNIARVEWYELSKEEVFTYPLQLGICKVHGSYKDTALKIWRDRFVNYWIFQTDPTEFDYKKAVNGNLLDSWKVAVGDKVKTNDKVVLWQTGARQGCYALARIISNPEPATSTENQLSKFESKFPLKVGIELTHNLIDNPLLWQNIKTAPGLQDLKLVNDANNFSITHNMIRC
ncbi:EVE domain-containing protein [Pinibacter soli]|uniref:EVE domain-containing protein n=1 Tax=Pinibacter soli TaxID=3044211 RepID=A0ABT6RHW9_9BACT|nr:EVE domain-containing protein [Pinibacter soli]MDI3321975.1 EVE domain-containing protein [Pinibacter soli]